MGPFFSLKNSKFFSCLKKWTHYYSLCCMIFEARSFLFTFKQIMPKNYVNNAYNRSVGRVGQPVGSHVISRSSGGGGGGGSLSSGISAAGSSTYSGASGSTKTYVDNAYNRREGRAGMPIGSCVISKNSTGNSSTPVGSGSGSGVKENVAVYADNPVNRRLGRVGKPRGTCVYSRKDGTTSSRTYADNKMNRKLGRVGEPLGSRPVSGKSSTTKEIKKWIDNHTIDKVRSYPASIFPFNEGLIHNLTLFQPM